MANNDEIKISILKSCIIKLVVNAIPPQLKNVM